MKKGLIVFVIIIVVIIGIKVITTKKDNTNTNKENIQTVSLEINTLSDLFPNENKEFEYKNGDVKTKVNVTDVTTNEDKKIVTTEREEKQNDENVTIQMKYEITSESVVESGKYILDGKDVSTIYPLEIIKGSLSFGSEWKSVDGLTTNKVVSTQKDKVTIESSRSVDVYEGENNKTPVKKTFVETRVFEKDKGVVLYKTETR